MQNRVTVTVRGQSYTLLAVEDEAILDAVYTIFKDRFKDILNFAE